MHAPDGETTAAGTGPPEAERVQAMFDRIAGVYDVMNAVMTAGLHARWRSRAADLAGLHEGGRALDVACGTGDLALELARRVGPGGHVVACDFAGAMLARAREKAAHARARDPQLAPLRFERADALALPYADSSFDAATVGFGVRNFADVPRGLAELVRVVRPGGRVVVLEITRPTRAPLKWFFGVWFERAVPLLGRAAGSADAYAYLPSSVRRFLSPRALAAQMHAVGLLEVRYLLTAGSIIAIHAGTVP
jgi:demethylmenaquinone methyltransferase/2-methoxy-6-polyprenyl-1,4-benzoquinol methylase